MWAWSRSTPIDAAHQHAMGCVSLRLVAMETQLRRDFKSATRLFSGLKERGHYTIGLECVYILSVQRMPGTWTDSWVEKEGFLMYGKTPCKKLKHSSQKMKHSSTPVRPLKWWVHNSTEESRFGFIGRVLPTRTQFLPLVVSPRSTFFRAGSILGSIFQWRYFSVCIYRVQVHICTWY